MKKRARGGIGKRKRLKISRVKTLPGSSPGAPTKKLIAKFKVAYPEIDDWTLLHTVQLILRNRHV